MKVPNVPSFAHTIQLVVNWAISRTKLQKSTEGKSVAHVDADLMKVTTVLDPRFKEYAFVKLQNYQNAASTVKDLIKLALNQQVWERDTCYEWPLINKFGKETHVMSTSEKNSSQIEKKSIVLI